VAEEDLEEEEVADAVDAGADEVNKIIINRINRKRSTK